MDRKTVLSFLDELEVKVISRQPNSGGYLPALCPFAPYLHERGVDTNPSFFVKVDNQKRSGFLCFTCKETGTMSSLVRRLSYHREESYGTLAVEADLAEIPDSFSDYPEEEELDLPPEPLNPHVYDNLYPDAWSVPEVRGYLESRVIGVDTARSLRLKCDEEERRILFPVLDRKETLYGFTGRSWLSPEQIEALNRKREKEGWRTAYSRHKDYHFSKERFLLGAHLLKKGRPVWIVEGLFALASIIDAGVEAFASPVATMGSSLSNHQRDILIDLGEPVYACYDDDIAGDIGLFGPQRSDGIHKGGGLIDKLKGDVPVLMPPYPDDLKDIDQVTEDQLKWMKESAKLC